MSVRMVFGALVVVVAATWSTSVPASTLICARPVPKAVAQMVGGSTNNPDDATLNNISYIMLKYCRPLDGTVTATAAVDLGDGCYQASGPYHGELVYWVTCDGPPEIVDLPSEPQGNSPTPISGHWEFNGSTFSAKRFRGKLQFYYTMPRVGLRDIGVSPGTLFMDLDESGSAYSGTAYKFSKVCGHVAYKVIGAFDPQNKEVSVRGKIPTVDKSCAVVKSAEFTVGMKFIEDAQE